MRTVVPQKAQAKAEKAETVQKAEKRNNAFKVKAAEKKTIFSFAFKCAKTAKKKQIVAHKQRRLDYFAACDDAEAKERARKVVAAQRPFL